MTVPNRPLWWASVLMVSAYSVPALGQSKTVTPHHRAGAVAPARSLTGSYDGPHQCTLDVLELPGGRIKFYLLALSQRLDRGAPNTGEASGVLPLHGGVAVYYSGAGTPDADDQDEKVVMRFQKGRVIIFQHGDAGFGQGVDATGTYIRHSRRVPVFDKEGRSN